MLLRKNYELLFETALATEDPAIQIALAKVLEKGEGVEPNLMRAKLWYSRAADQGNHEASIQNKRLASLLETKSESKLPTVESVTVDLGKIMKDAGYHMIPDEGICQGFSMKGIEALFIDELDVFAERVHQIHRANEQGELKDVCHVNIGKKKALTAKDQNHLDMYAFFDGIALYLSPHRFSEQLGRYVSQIQTEKIAPLTASVVLEVQGGIVKVGQTIASSFTKQELNNYYAFLVASVHEYNNDIAFNLGSHDHSIAIGYQAKTKRWILFDINQLPYEVISPENLVNVFESSFSRCCRWTSYVFSVAMYSPGNRFEQAQTFYNKFIKADAFKEIQYVTLRKIQQDDSFLNLAAQDDDVATVKSIVGITKKGVNERINDMYPIQMAIHYNCIKVLPCLLVAGANVNTCNLLDGSTMLEMAVCHNQIEIIKILLGTGVNVNLINKRTGMTPVHYAAEKNHVDALALLLKMPDVQCYLPAKNGLTPIHVAAKNGCFEAMKLLWPYFPSSCVEIFIMLGWIAEGLEKRFMKLPSEKQQHNENAKNIVKKFLVCFYANIYVYFTKDAMRIKAMLTIFSNVIHVALQVCEARDAREVNAYLDAFKRNIMGIQNALKRYKSGRFFDSDKLADLLQNAVTQVFLAEEKPQLCVVNK